MSDFKLICNMDSVTVISVILRNMKRLKKKLQVYKDNAKLQGENESE